MQPNNDINHKSKQPHMALNNAHYRTFVLDRPFILTQGNSLTTGMPYLYTEGSFMAAVRIKDIYECERIIHLLLEELKSGRRFTVSWNLEYTGGYYIWSIADLPTIMNITN